MCRNIKLLYNFDPPVTDSEVRAASLQFVRKISGINKPSKGKRGLVPGGHRCHREHLLGLSALA